MSVAVFPGSFDPVTLGHMDVIERAAELFDRVYICTMVNGGKSPRFTTEQRFAMLRAAVEGLENVTAELWTGLLASYAREKGARYLVKGVRNATDFDAEFGLAQINRGIEASLDTVLLPARARFAHFSSTMVREMIKYRQPLEAYMPAAAVRLLQGWENKGES